MTATPRVTYSLATARKSGLLCQRRTAWSNSRNFAASASVTKNETTVARWTPPGAKNATSSDLQILITHSDARAGAEKYAQQWHSKVYQNTLDSVPVFATWDPSGAVIAEFAEHGGRLYVINYL